MERRVIEPSDVDGRALLDCGHRTDVGATARGTFAEGPMDCGPCDHRQLPETVTKGRTTPTFTAGTVPPALLSDHRTNAWAALIVSAGSVDFLEPDPAWGATVMAGDSVVIVPGRPHHIVPSEDAVFAVQFFDLPAALNPTEGQS